MTDPIGIAELLERVDRVLPETVELRRDLHRHPETRLEERRTAGVVRGLLRELPVEVLPPYLETDTVALLRGRDSSGPNVILRADIDALPLQEESGAPWASTRPGFAHACGHDGHTAMLIGAARVLAGLADRFSGSVRFVFQPAEEESGGGRQMVEKGLLDADPRPRAAFALHGWPGLPVGTLASRPGPMMAAADRFTLTVRGRGGHGAQPHRGVDPIVTAARVIDGLQTIVSRTVDPIEPAVVSVCTIHGGTARNVIPDAVVMEGTTRYFRASLQQVLRDRMEEVARGVCLSAGAEYIFDYRPGYRPLINDPSMVELARSVVQDTLGQRSWNAELPPGMGAEDFSYYLAQVPGAMLRLGLGEEHPALHTAGFDFNDEAIRPGVAVLCALALRVLAV